MPGQKSNKRKADDFEKIEAQKAREKEVNAEIGRLISICGGLETHENIESAYNYHVVLSNSHEDVIKRDALAAYMSKYGPELERMNLMEMSLYRKIRQTSEFFLGAYLMEPETVAMLAITIDEWIWSEREGKLSEKHKEIAGQVEATGGSRAEMFRATMAQYKAEMVIQGWDEDSLNLLRLSICQGGRNQLGEPSSNDSNFDVDSDSDSDYSSSSDYGHSAKRPRLGHSRTTRARDKHHIHIGPSNTIRALTTPDGHSASISSASRGIPGPSSSNIPPVSKPNSSDKDKDNGETIDHAPATPPVSLKSPNVLATPSPSTPPSPLNTQDKIQRFKDLAASLTSTITNFEKSIERANVERYLVKVTALELKSEIDDMLKDDTEWTVESTSRRAAKFEPLLRKFSKSWQTDLPASLGVKEETSKTIERTETMLSELNERLSPTTNGTARISGT